MLTLLTEKEGKISVRARGALRKSCKYGAATQLLSFSELTLFGNRGRWSLNEAETIEQFLPLRDDLAKLSLGTYFVELMEAVSDEDSPNPELLRLGLNSLFALSRGAYDAEHIKAVFELRQMCLSGYEPMLETCDGCGEVNITQPMFSADGGVLLCNNCRRNGFTTPLELCAASLAAMRYIVSCEPTRVFSFTIEADAQKRLYDACERYCLTQLERSFTALDYWKKIR